MTTLCMLSERASLSVDHVLFCVLTSGFEVGIWVMIATVPGHCILVTFRK